jgi:N-acetylglucosaminyl-diphospho-decaprenol L-rhamnosyltransferase
LSAPRVAIAVVSTNLRELLAACLRSMKPEADRGHAEVWVVDNASEDGSPEMVRSEFPWARLVASDVNLGYGRAVNLVAERSSAPWIAPANEDIELRRGALDALLAAGEAHPEAAIVAPRLELPGGRTQHSVHAFPTVGFTAAFNLGLFRLAPGLADRYCLEGAWDETRSREVPWAMATFMLVRREAFDAVGGFARDQFIHSEDIDLAWRLRRAGWTTRFQPAATVLHAGSAASKKAFGEELWTRWMAATYSWMARRRGLRIARSVAALNVAGAAARWAALAPAAALAPGRYAAPRDRYRHWCRVHLTGLRPRRELLREH